MAKSKKSLEDSLIKELNFMKGWALRHVLMTDYKTKQEIKNANKQIENYLLRQKKLKYKNGRAN